MDYRSGIGYDTHQLAPNRALILGGVQIPHSYGLLGHSDADVLVHAIMDALLGAACLGDIGQHFPDAEAAYKDVSSMVLLKEVYELIRKEGWIVVNVDSLIIAQKPRLAPFISDMRQNIVQCIETEAVNIKATTEEGLGFVGREEGISAQAVCLLKLTEGSDFGGAHHFC